MVNKNLYDFIIQSHGEDTLKKAISKFIELIQKELQEYIPNWEIMDLQVEENFEGTNSIYLWLHEQFAGGKKEKSELISLVQYLSLVKLISTFLMTTVHLRMDTASLIQTTLLLEQ
jgi:hypothetical protein